MAFPFFVDIAGRVSPTIDHVLPCFLNISIHFPNVNEHCDLPNIIFDDSVLLFVLLDVPVSTFCTGFDFFDIRITSIVSSRCAI